jgi:hypothetical protein
MKHVIKQHRALQSSHKQVQWNNCRVNSGLIAPFAASPASCLAPSAQRPILLRYISMLSSRQELPRVSIRSPKLVLWNNALVNALSTRAFADALGDTIWWGWLVENAIGACLCNGLHSVEYELTYWREGDHEVDYVVARGRDIWAIEVKSSRSGKASGLVRFRSRYPKAKALLVGGQGIPREAFSSKEPAWWLV